MVVQVTSALASVQADLYQEEKLLLRLAFHQFFGYVKSPFNFACPAKPLKAFRRPAGFGRKIDVVGYTDSAVDVIEIKPHAGPSAIGQVLCYVDLYKGYRDPDSNPRAVLITDSVENDMPYLCAHYDVRLIVV